MIECNGRDHDKVDKISDEIYALSPNVILKFNVSLSKISGGKRYYFHNEFEYGSPKYQESNLITIKRSFDYYLSFESAKTSDNGSRMFVRIGIQEFLSLSDALKEVLKWYTDVKYDKLYAFDKSGKLIITSPSPSHTIPKLPMGKSIEFRPTIISKGMANADDEMGIAMDFGDDGTIELTFDKFMGLYYLITSFNMYQSALLLINYIGHPDIGTNRVVMESSSRRKPLPQIPEQETTSIKGRFPKAMKNNISQLEGDLKLKHILNSINDSDANKSVKALSEYIHGDADSSFANSIIRSTFGVNIYDAANMLYYQEKFFNYQFPYLSKYLEDLKVSHSLVYYKYANLMSVKDIFSLDVENKRDPSVIWTGKDLEYTGNKSRDILNPYNCFYRVNLQLSLDNSDNHTLFLLKVSDEFGLGDCFRDKVIDKIPITITLDFNDIQCRFYEMVDKLIRLAHRYL